MRQRKIRLGIVCLALWCPSREAMAGGTVLTSSQTQSTSPEGILVASNWGPGTTGVNAPLTFQQARPDQGTLTSIDITMTTTIRNDYELVFVKTPIITTIDVATSQTTDPSVLADPAKRALLTDGPTVTLFGPGGSTTIFGAPGTRQPVDFVQMTESSGTYSSLLPITSPFFIPPTMTVQTFSLSLTASDAPSLFADFIGTGTVDLPVTATASSSFYSNSGNGGGAVITKASATVSIVYNFASVPEPSSAILLGLGIGIGLLAKRLRTRRLSQTWMKDAA
jgi:PEP-CTERM motif